MCVHLLSIESIDDRQVCRQERLLRERGRAHPLEPLALEARGLAPILIDDERLELDHVLPVIMPQLAQ
jgi:hypothetical protein